MFLGSGDHYSGVICAVMAGLIQVGIPVCFMYDRRTDRDMLR
jgi:hypothetical protein